MVRRQNLWPVVTVLAILLIWLQVGCSNSDQRVATSDKQQNATSSQSSDGQSQEASTGDSTERYKERAEKCADSHAARRSTDGVKPGSSPGGKIAFARGYWQGQYLRTDIYVVNPEGTWETRLTQTKKDENNPVWSPDGEKIAFIRASYPNDIYQLENDIYVVNPDGTGEMRLTHFTVEGLRTNDASSPLAWSPDGEKIAFVESSDGTADIYTIDVDGTNRTRLTNTKSSAGGLTGINDPVWSPDGEKIAFQRVYEEQSSANSSTGADTLTISEIYVMNADGTCLRKLPIESEYQDASAAAWSPDSKKIAFSTSEGIYTINADGTDQTLVPGTSGRPQWLPNGEIGFTISTPSGKIEIYKISADGTNKTRLTQFDARGEQLTWSPDGERIAYYTIRVGGRHTEFTIYVVNTDGTGPTRVADDIFGSTLGPPSWGGTD